MISILLHSVEKISIELMGLVLFEPITYISNILLAGFSLFWYYRLKVLGDDSEMSRSFSRYFLFMGLAPFISGQAHLFDYYIHHNYLHVVGWSFIALGTYYFQRGSAADYSTKLKKRLNLAFIILLITSIVTYFGYQALFVLDTEKITVGVPGFFAVSISSAIGYVLFLVPMNYVKYRYQKNAGSGVILLGIVLSAFTLVLHSKKFTIGPHINHNVLSHVVLIFCYYLYFLGMKKKIIGFEAVV